MLRSILLNKSLYSPASAGHFKYIIYTPTRPPIVVVIIVTYTLSTSLYSYITIGRVLDT